MVEQKALISVLLFTVLVSALSYTENAFAGAPSDSPIGNFGTLTTLGEAEQMVVNLKIKLPDSSTLPEGYSLQAVLVKPIGEVTRETFSNRTFRPEMLHLYFSDKPVNGSMFTSDHPEWIIITESYSLGSNSTRAYTENQEIPEDTTVGWFFGYPGYMRGSTLLVYQFEEEMVYQIYSVFLTQEEMLAISKSLLLENESIIDTTTITNTTRTVSTVTTTTTMSVNDFSTAVEQVNHNSLRVVVLDSGSEQKVVMNNTDPRFENLLQHLNNSSLMKTIPKTTTIVEGNRTTTVTTVTIPYPWGYVLTFELKDGSTIWFNCATENIWFETDQAIYQASFDPAFNTFLNNVTQETKDTADLQPEVIYTTIVIAAIVIIASLLILRKRR